VLGNLEYDHADIFPDLASIETQFHHLVRIVPGNGLLVVNGQDAALERVLSRGAWTPVARFGSGQAWSVGEVRPDDSFDVMLDRARQGTVRWSLMGEHNRVTVERRLYPGARIALSDARTHLASFEGVKRRQDLLGEPGGVRVYDDFAHHPTAFEVTIAGLRTRVGDARIIAVFEPRSNTMKLGTMQGRLAKSLGEADVVRCYARDLGWDPAQALAPLGTRAAVHRDLGELVEEIARIARPGDHVLVMSNGGFGGIHERLLARLERSATPAAAR
jgi:UDP-N-acetylmuramate: L-alanyl-gamma-D-glutamyl-meso-diaminopimelate ligase